MGPLRKGSFLEVDLNLLRYNIQELRKLNPQNEILFMVKADAYGHGLISIVEFAARECGLSEFGVATLSEALYLRNSLPDLKIEIYVFSELGLELPEDGEVYLQNRIIPVIARKEDFDLFLESQNLRENLPLCLKFNTGMNRLGLHWKNCDEIIKKMKERGVREIFHLMAHFANSSLSLEDHDLNRLQQSRFKEVKEKIGRAQIEVRRISLANSGAIEQGGGAEETHIRPGLMLYGPSSLDESIRHKSLWKGKVISSLKTSVLHIFPVKKGDLLGYGSTPAPDSGTVAILGIGYGDGVGSFYQGAFLFHKGVRGKICARVCMDMTYVLFSCEVDLKVGESFEIWGHQRGEIENLAKQNGILSYELVILLTSRISRIYRLN